MKAFFFFLLIVAGAAVAAQDKLPVGTIFPTREIPVHDPVMIKEKDRYYIFCTGFGISVWLSNDLKYWRKEAPVFSKALQWAADAIPNFKGHIWAPDINYHNGQYYLFYSVSAFGKNTSAIGLATNKTLDPSSPGFKWIDHGRVIQSYPGKTNWNAIDPNLIVDEKGNAFLSFGSFWDGLKLVKLTKDLLHPAGSPANIPTIASRKKNSSDENPLQLNAGDNAIEAPFIFKKGSYYYLFASIDYCCKGEQSTYKVIVGRSKNITGPYLDKEEKELRSGGGTILVQGNGEWYGTGHNGLCSSDGKDYIIYHGYDAKDKGRSKLIIKELKWNKDGWPLIVDLY
jgi:arabinan endo-1,5-alpha-L-arabinosidase